MATITIRNLDEATKKNLRLSAAMHGCSMEEEARRILSRTLIAQGHQKGLGSRIHQRFKKIGGFELPLPSRSMARPAPDFIKEENE